MSNSTKPNSRYAGYRPVIAALVRALCAVPKEARREWIDELMKAGTGVDAVAPDDLVVRQVLINLDVAEDVANSRHEELKPKLYPIVGGEVVRRRRRGSGSEPESPGRGDGDGKPRAA